MRVKALFVCVFFVEHSEKFKQGAQMFVLENESDHLVSLSVLTNKSFCFVTFISFSVSATEGSVNRGRV